MAALQNDLAERLNRLMAGEHAGVFRFLAAAGPYLHGPAAHLRPGLERMAAESEANERELAELIEAHNGIARPAPVNMDLQTLGFVSLGYLLPRLVSAKRAAIAEYRAVLETVEEEAVRAVLRRHLERHEGDLQVLEGTPHPGLMDPVAPTPG
jgi:hypothetical protein